MRMEGKWIGQYTYGEGYPDSVKGKSVRFEMNLEKNGIEFHGNFSDDETRHIFQENGVVAGFLEGDYIAFEMQYPKCWQITDKGEIEILEDAFPHLIKHVGTRLGMEFSGTWQIVEFFEEDDKVVVASTGTGTWRMAKEVGEYR